MSTLSSPLGSARPTWLAHAALLALLTPASMGARVPEADEGLEGLALVVRELRDSRLPEAPEFDEIVERVVPALRQNLPGIYQILMQRTVPALRSDEQPQRLSEPQTELLARALSQVERDTALQQLDLFLGASATLQARALEIELLGCVGHQGDIPRLLSLALSPEEFDLDLAVDPWVEIKLRGSLESILRRHADGYSTLLECWRDTAPPLLPVIILAIGDARGSAGVEILESMATRNPELALSALTQIRHLGRSPSERVNKDMILTARRHLDPERPDRCQTVVLALGELEDVDSVPTLIEYLESGSEGLRQSVVWALRRISGMGFGGSVKLWRRWYSEEQTWHIEHRARVFDELASANRSRVTEAIKAIGRHRLYRHELASDLAEQLPWLPTDLWPLTCHVLGQLGSEQAIPHLLSVLEQEDPVLAEAGRSALERILGRDYGLDPEAWRRGLGKRPG